MPDVVILLTTAPVEAGESLARRLVEAQAAACVNVLPPMVSIYRWKGEVQRDRECQLVIKTTADRVQTARDLLRVHHPYDLPECLILRVDDGDPAYLGWVATQTREGGEG
jgi:periplasmic divalent cation tolerance protein